MVNQELLEYIKILKIQSEINDTGKSKLMAMNKWKEQEIDQAFQIENTAPNIETPVVAVTKSLDEPEKSQISKIIFVSFCLLSALSIFRFCTSIIPLIDIYPKYLTSINYLYDYHWFLAIPLILAFSTILIFYSTFKIRILNKKNAVFALIATFVSFFLFSLSESLALLVLNGNLGSLSNPLNFAFIPILLVLIFSFSKPPESDRQILSEEKSLFALPCLLILAASLYIIINQLAILYRITHLDSFDKVQYNTFFTINMPFQLPPDFHYSSDLKPNSSIGKMTGAIEVIVNGKNGDILISQVGINEYFSILDFIGSTDSTKIELPSSKDGFAYLIENTKIKKSPIMLYFITPGNVFIRMVSNKVSQDSVIQIAGSLK